MKEIVGFICKKETDVAFTPILKSDETKEATEAFRLVNTVKINSHLWKAIIQTVIADIHYEKFLTDYFTILDEFKQIKEEFKIIKERSK